jgi:hypothetical protein
MKIALGPAGILAAIAAIIFLVASLGEWPSDLRDDVEPVALGLAFLAASLVVAER